MGDDHRKKVFWNDMISKTKSKLSSWKGKQLSFAGRVTLIKSFISVVPLYYLSLFKMSGLNGTFYVNPNRKED